MRAEAWDNEEQAVIWAAREHIAMEGDQHIV